MKSLWERLIEILEKESALYRDILDLSRHKTNTIVEGRVSQLEQLTGVEQKLLLNVGGLEQQREEVVDQLARLLGIPADGLNIGVAVEQAEDELKEKLIALKDEIENTLKDLKEVNDLNSELIKKSLEYIDFLLTLLPGPEDVTYDAKGQGQGQGCKLLTKKCN